LAAAKVLPTFLQLEPLDLLFGFEKRTLGDSKSMHKDRTRLSF
jgi:hypothetical protein